MVFWERRSVAGGVVSVELLQSELRREGEKRDWTERMIRLGTARLVVGVRRWGLGVLAAVLLLPSGARAEGGVPGCERQRPWPPAGPIPADQPAFVMSASRPGPEPIVELWQTLGEAEPTQVPATLHVVSTEYEDRFVVIPSEPLTVGARVEFRGDVCGIYGVGRFEVAYEVGRGEATPPAPPLRLETQVRGYTRDGYFERFAAEVTLYVEGGGVLEEWFPWIEPSLAVGETRERTYATGRQSSVAPPLACRDGAGLTPGPQLVVAALRTLTGETLHELREERVFDCDDARFFDLDTGDELTPEDVARLRPRPMDAGVPVRDASTSRPMDAGVPVRDASTSRPLDAGMEDTVGEGGCAVGASHAAPATWLLLLAFVARRRASRPRLAGDGGSFPHRHRPGKG